MSLIVKDFECRNCEITFTDVLYERGEELTCPECGDWLNSLLTWNGACDGLDTGWMYSSSMDKWYENNKHLKDDAKSTGHTQHSSADKHHGARNEGHRLTGNIVSYPGKKNLGTTITTNPSKEGTIEPR